MTGEMNRQAWLRTAAVVVSFVGVVWGASAHYSKTDERSIRNETSVASLKNNAKEVKERNDLEFRALREKDFALELKSSQGELRQEQILTRLDRMEGADKERWSEMKTFLQTLEFTDQGE